MSLTPRMLILLAVVTLVSCGDEAERSPLAPDESSTPVSVMAEYAEAFIAGDKESLAQLLDLEFTYEVEGLCPHAGPCRDAYPMNYVEEVDNLGHIMDSDDPGPGPAVAERQMTSTVSAAQTMSGGDVRCMVQLDIRIQTVESPTLLSHPDIQVTFRRNRTGALQILKMVEYTLFRSPSGCWAETRCLWH